MTSNETPGYPAGSPQAAPPVVQGTNVSGVIGLILGILGLLASPVSLFGIVSGFAFVSVLLPVGGLVLSIIGKKKASEGAGGSGIALGGLIVSIIALVLSLAFAGCAVACNAATTKMKQEAEKQGVHFDQINKDFQKDRAKWDEFNADLAEAGKEWEKATDEMKKAADEAQKQLPAATDSEPAAQPEPEEEQAP